MKTDVLNLRLPQLALLTSLLLLGVGVTYAAEDAAAGETRVTATTQGQGINRGSLDAASEAIVEHPSLKTAGKRQKPQANAVQQKLNAASRSTANVDFWFYDTDIVLFSDFDGDGFYYGIDLLFDVDTVYSSADVFAVIYLSYELGPWNEVAETEVFSIFGASADDEYIVETELLSGYLTGDYDMLIEVYDTFDNALVASFGPDETSELSLLPLEDAARDAPQETIVVVTSGGGGGGASTWAFAMALLGFVLLRLYRRQPV